MTRLNDDQAKALGLGHLIPKRRKPERPEDGMNKLERSYADRLETEKRVDYIRDWAFEPEKLRLAGRTFYTPDFRVVLANGLIEFHECKGPYAREDSIVKLKVAAELHPCYTFRLVYKNGVGWDIRPVGRGGIGKKGGDHA
jgi:hypothetical protein